MTTTVTFPVRGAAPYDVVIGRDLLPRVLDMIGERAERVAVLYPTDAIERVEPLLDVLRPHYDVLGLGVPLGEYAKTTAVAHECWESLGEAGFTRSDVVIAMGGGATTDLGGFVAATWLRGVRVVQIPTTLLGMVDAAVGGKTGLNSGAGKNLVGAFHEPAGVICDLATLDTLAEPELIAGMGEVVKCGFIADPEILRLIDADPQGALDPHSDTLAELVRRAVAVKIDVVVADLRETGGIGAHPGREALNYGHTLAHAIERATGYQIRHGEAVAIGCVFAAELAQQAGLIDKALVQRHRDAFGKVGLPTGWASDATSFDDLLATMRVDKKARGSQLRFLVLHDLATPRILAGPEEDWLRRSYSAIAGA